MRKFLYLLLLLLLPTLANAAAYVPWRMAWDGDQLSTYTPPGVSCTGVTYYVDPAGDDGEPGTSPGTAWATVGQVNDSMGDFSGGDCIRFKRGGSWAEQLLITKSGTDADNRLTFTAYGDGAKPTINLGGAGLANVNHGAIRGSGVNYLTIDNLWVQNIGTGDGVADNSNTGIGFYQGSYITVQNCKTSWTEAAGIKFNETSNVVVENNEVEGACQDSTEESISMNYNPYFEIMYNTVYNGGTGAGGGAGVDAKNGSHDGSIHHNNIYAINGANAIYIDAYSRYTYNISVYANYIHDTDGTAIQLGTEEGAVLENVYVYSNVATRAKRGVAFHNKADGAGSLKNIHIVNNTFYQNGDASEDQYGMFRIWYPSFDGLYIRNNVIVDNENFQLGTQVGTANMTVSDNLISGPNTGTVGGFATFYTAGTGSNYISGAPVFTGTGSEPASLELQASSPGYQECDPAVLAGIANMVDYNGTVITDSNGTVVVDQLSCGAFQ